MSEETSAKSGFMAGLTRLQKLTLTLAAAVSIAGAGLWLFAALAEHRPAVAVQSEPAGEDPQLAPQGFTDDATARSDGAAPEEDEERTPLQLYSPTIFRLGFAFFLGFAVAYAVRAALKLLLIVVGAALLIVVGLQMGGLITVNWGAMDGTYQSAGAWLGEQTESFAAFVRGYIPSGGTALAGFGVGLTRKH